MEGKEGELIAENAAEVLAAIARARTPPLTYILGAPDNIHRLVTFCSKSETRTQPLVQVGQPKIDCACKRFLHPTSKA